MAQPTPPNRARSLRIAGWLLLVSVFLYLHFSRADFVHGELQSAFSASVLAGYAVYLLLGCIRGFTFVPSTNLVFAAIPFLAPLPLFVLTLIGILVSSACIYQFSGSLQLAEFFERTHKVRVERMKAILEKNQMPIIVGWSFFPLAPTDLICYVCGILKVNFLKFMLGVLVGEGAICGIYIFLGDFILRWLRWRA